jgi:hypothetical protein
MYLELWMEKLLTCLQIVKVVFTKWMCIESDADESLVFTYCSSTVSEKSSWPILPDNSIFTWSLVVIKA